MLSISGKLSKTIYISRIYVFFFSADQSSVVHLAHKIDKFKYKFCCGITVGGVLGMWKDQFIKVNGYSNEYYVIIFPIYRKIETGKMHCMF